MRHVIRSFICCVAIAGQTWAAEQVADSTTYLAEFVRLAQLDWPANRTLRIVCHGHSVPSGYFKTPEVRTFDSYPMLMHQGLAERFPHAVINVSVTAIGGENSVSGAGRFEKDVLALQPDIVTIDYSLNDRPLGLEQTEAAWSSMIERAQAKGIQVILLTPSPDETMDVNNLNDPLHQHAALVRKLAAKYRTGLIDSLEIFLKAAREGESLKSFMSQFNHPNRKGHELIAAELLKWFP